MPATPHDEQRSAPTREAPVFAYSWLDRLCTELDEVCNLDLPSVRAGHSRFALCSTAKLEHASAHSNHVAHLQLHVAA